MKPSQAELFYGDYYEKGEKIRAEHVERYSYRFTARFMTIGGKYKLFELLPSRGDQPAEYCFLTIDKNQGVIIPEPFYQHRLKLIAMSPAPAPKRSVPKPAALPPPLPKINPHPDQDKREEPRSTLPEEKRNGAAVDRWAI